MKKMKRVRINLHVPEAMYNMLKESAEFRKLKLTRWVLQAIMLKLQEDKKYE